MFFRTEALERIPVGADYISELAPIRLRLGSGGEFPLSQVRAAHLNYGVVVRDFNEATGKPGCFRNVAQCRQRIVVCRDDSKERAVKSYFKEAHAREGKSADVLRSTECTRESEMRVGREWEVAAQNVQMEGHVRSLIDPT